jgi:hypothetical protein
VKDLGQNPPAFLCLGGFFILLTYREIIKNGIFMVRIPTKLSRYLINLFHISTKKLIYVDDYEQYERFNRPEIKDIQDYL